MLQHGVFLCEAWLLTQKDDDHSRAPEMTIGFSGSHQESTVFGNVLAMSTSRHDANDLDMVYSIP